MNCSTNNGGALYHVKVVKLLRKLGAIVDTMHKSFGAPADVAESRGVIQNWHRNSVCTVNRYVLEFHV